MLGANTIFFQIQLSACLPHASKPKSQSESQFPLASKILVRNLPYSTEGCRLRKEFSCFGPITEVKLVKDESTKKSKGYAFIQYTTEDDAMLALENMDHQYFDGRVIYVELAKPRNDLRSEIPFAVGPPKETIRRRVNL